MEARHIRYINALTDVALNTLSLADIAVQGTTGLESRGYIRDNRGGETELRATGVLTRIGNIKADIWDALAKAVIKNQPDGEKMLAALDKYLEAYGNKFMQTHPEERMHDALVLCADEKFADKDWEGYEKLQNFL